MMGFSQLRLLCCLNNAEWCVIFAAVYIYIYILLFFFFLGITHRAKSTHIWRMCFCSPHRRQLLDIRIRNWQSHALCAILFRRDHLSRPNKICQCVCVYVCPRAILFSHTVTHTHNENPFDFRMYYTHFISICLIIYRLCKDVGRCGIPI